MNDDDLRRIMSNDQLASAAADMARGAIVYWKELRKGGMNRSEALKMTINWVSSIILMSSQQNKQ